MASVSSDMINLQFFYFDLKIMFQHIEVVTPKQVPTIYNTGIIGLSLSLDNSAQLIRVAYGRKMSSRGKKRFTWSKYFTMSKFVICLRIKYSQHCNQNTIAYHLEK